MSRVATSLEWTSQAVLRAAASTAASSVATVLFLWGATFAERVGAAGVFDIAPLSPPRVVSADYFGTHFHRLRIPPRLRGKDPVTEWPTGIVGAVRLWDSRTRWADIEPAPGQFDFEQLDHYVAQAEANAATVMLVLGSTPRWASARPWEPCPYGSGCIAEPADLRHWDRYVETVARRYRGRIALYELWNEPYFSEFPKDRGHPGAFFTGSAETMVEMARLARAALDRVSPQAVLLTPGFTGSTDRLDLFLSKGGARYVGGVAFHYYVGTDQDFIDMHRRVRAVMVRHGLGTLPLYNTESGFEILSTGAAAGPPLGVPKMDERSVAAQTASGLVLGAFLGLGGYYQFAWDNTRMGMLRADGRSATAGLQAYSSVRRWLTGARLGACKALPQGVVRCSLQRDGQHVAVLWRPGAAAVAHIELPQDLEILALDDAISGPVAIATDHPARRSLAVGAVPLALQTRGPWEMPVPSGVAP